MTLARRMVCRVAGCRAGDDGGNAIVEFVYLAVLLMVPLTYVLLTVFHVQRASYAASSAAREAGRAFATSTEGDAAQDRAVLAARLVMRDSGLRLDASDVRIACSTTPCLEPGSTIRVSVSQDVSLPLLPRLFGDRAPAVVHVSSEHLEVVDRYRQVG